VRPSFDVFGRELIVANPLHFRGMRPSVRRRVRSALGQFGLSTANRHSRGIGFAKARNNCALPERARTPVWETLPIRRGSDLSIESETLSVE
jgi:hypothetical protein